MNDYILWLNLTRKWATSRLTANEYRKWDTLSTQLGKNCLEENCGNGEICLFCDNTGLNLTESEKMLMDAWETIGTLKKTLEGTA